MKGKSFVTTLFMFVVGTMFIIIVLVADFILLKSYIEKTYIKNNGVQVEAKVSSKFHYDYEIEYEVNGQNYSYRFEANKKDYNENDIMPIYCLLDNPKKVSIDIEKRVRNRYRID